MAESVARTSKRETALIITLFHCSALDLRRNVQTHLSTTKPCRLLRLGLCHRFDLSHLKHRSLSELIVQFYFALPLLIAT